MPNFTERTQITDKPNEAAQIAAYYNPKHDGSYTNVTQQQIQRACTTEYASPSVEPQQLEADARQQRQLVLDIWQSYTAAKTLKPLYTDIHDQEILPHDSFIEQIKETLDDNNINESATCEQDHKYQSYAAGVASVCRFYYNHSRHIAFPGEKAITTTAYSGSLSYLHGIFDTCILLQADISAKTHIIEMPEKRLKHNDLVKYMLCRLVAHVQKQIEANHPDLPRPEQASLGYVATYHAITTLEEDKLDHIKAQELKDALVQILQTHYPHQYYLTHITARAEITITLPKNIFTVLKLPEDQTTYTCHYDSAAQEHNPDELTNRITEIPPGIQQNGAQMTYKGGVLRHAMLFYDKLEERYSQLLAPAYLSFIGRLVLNWSYAKVFFLFSMMSYANSLDFETFLKDFTSMIPQRQQESDIISRIGLIAMGIIQYIFTPQNFFFSIFSIVISGSLSTLWSSLNPAAMLLSLAMWTIIWPHNPPSFMPRPAAHLAMLMLNLYVGATTTWTTWLLLNVMLVTIFCVKETVGRNHNILSIHNWAKRGFRNDERYEPRVVTSRELVTSRALMPQEHAPSAPSLDEYSAIMPSAPQADL